MLRLAALVVVPVTLLAACTSGSDPDQPSADDVEASTSSPATTTTGGAPPAGPPCTDVWVAGGVLPADYTSCVEADGTAGRQDVVECTDGTSLVVHRDAMYAVTGGPVVEPTDAPLQDTDEYGAVYRACAG